MTDTHRVRHPDTDGRLNRAIAAWKEQPAARDAWRQSLLDRIASGEAAAQEDNATGIGRRDAWWRSRTVAVLAAGFVGLAIGVGGTYGVMRAVSRAPVASGAVASRGGLTAASSLSPATPALPVRFALLAPDAVHVSLVGDFDGWNPRALPMRRLPDGHTWEVQVELPPGRYAYAFVVDGRLARDPTAPQSVSGDFGTANSIVIVRNSGGTGL